MIKLFRIPAGMVLAILLASHASFADTVMIDPAITSVSVGHTFTVDINIEDVSDLYSFQFDLGFDPEVLQAIRVYDVSFLSESGENWPYEGDIDNTAGSIANIYDVLLGNVSGAMGSGLLATIEFKAIATGTGSLNILNSNFLDSMLDPIDVNLQGARYIVAGSAAIPEPSTILLLSGGLIALAVAARRKIRK